METGQSDEVGAVGEEVAGAMNRIVISGLFLLVCLAGCNRDTSSQTAKYQSPRTLVAPVGPWRRFISTRGGYSIDFPGVPVEKNLSIRNARAFSAEVRVRGAEGTRAFSATSTTFLPRGLAQIGPQAFMEKLYQEVWAPKLKGRLIYKRSFVWNGAPALELRYGNAPTQAQPQPAQVVMRWFVVKDTVYDLTIIERLQQLTTGDVARFYNSFRLGKPPVPPKYSPK